MTENDRGDLYRVIWNCYSSPMTISQLSSADGSPYRRHAVARRRRERSTGANFCVVASRKLRIQPNFAGPCIAVGAPRF